MRKLLILTAGVTLAFGFAGTAKADTCSPTDCVSSGGVTYTATQGGSDGSGVFDVTLTINTSGATSSATLKSFSIQFDNNKQNVSIESAPAGSGTWVSEGLAPNTGKGCNTKGGSANHWCFDGGNISVAPGGGSFTFVFDVKTSGGAPTKFDIQTLQGTDLSISTGTGIGAPPTTTTPEPASMLLLGLGLVGVPFLRRKRS
jgi:PEP-CTERM motif